MRGQSREAVVNEDRSGSKSESATSPESIVQDDSSLNATENYKSVRSSRENYCPSRRIRSRRLVFDVSYFDEEARDPEKRRVPE